MFRLLTFTCCCLTSIASNTANADVIDGEDLRDPTRPLFATTNRSAVSSSLLSALPIPSLSSYEVSFVRAGGSNPIAVVNDERVGLGDSVGGAIVREIKRSGVVLEIAGELRTVSMYDDVVGRAQNLD